MLQNKTIIVTGANTGIGKETTRELARLGARVAMVCRSETTGEAARQEIIADTRSDRVTLHVADFGSLGQIRSVAAELQATYPVIDVLVNNAGLILPRRELSADGYEMTIAVNHLAPFLLTNLLLGNIAAAPAGRIVNVASNVHKSGTIHRDDLMLSSNYSATRAYGQSKLANVLFTRELARRVEDSAVTANALHPGVVATDFGRNFTGAIKYGYRLFSQFFIGPAKGALTSIYLASSPEVDGVTGGYFAKRRAAEPSAEAQDAALAAWLWEESERLVGLG